jgi:UDP-glucose 4-epimerase
VTSPQDNRILVTGGGGFIGIPTVRKLLGRGADVVVLDNFAVGSRDRLEELSEMGHLTILPVDLRDADAVRSAIRESDVSAVIHLAAIHFIPYCVSHPSETLAVNVLGTQHLLEALADSPVSRLVFASTGDVYVPATTAHREHDALGAGNVYGASKLMGEQLLALHSHDRPSLEIVVARLFNTYGDGETNPHVLPDILAYMRAGDELPLGNTENRRDYVYVEDVAAALCELVAADLSERLTTVNVGTGRSLSVDDLVERLRELTQRPLRIQTDPAKLRKSDRPTLQADTAKRQQLLPDLCFRDVPEGLRLTLEAEGLLDPFVKQPEF